MLDEYDVYGGEMYYTISTVKTEKSEKFEKAKIVKSSFSLSLE